MVCASPAATHDRGGTPTRRVGSKCVCASPGVGRHRVSKRGREPHDHGRGPCLLVTQSEAPVLAPAPDVGASVHGQRHRVPRPAAHDLGEERVRGGAQQGGEGEGARRHQAVARPARTARRTLPWISTRVSLSAALRLGPRPSCPAMPSPQVKHCPVSSSTTVWTWPQETATARDGLGIGASAREEAEALPPAA